MRRSEMFRAGSVSLWVSAVIVILVVIVMGGCSGTNDGARVGAGGQAGGVSSTAGTNGAAGDHGGASGGQAGPGSAGARASAGTSGGPGASSDASTEVAASGRDADASLDTMEDVVLEGDGPSRAEWTGTWGASPVATGMTFNQQTLREIVHTSIGGAAARLHFSNAFGNQPVTIRDVHIARRTTGSSIDGTTDRIATFGGMVSVTIAVGAEAITDRIDFAVAPLSDVAVSLYLQSTGSATAHGMSDQTNYVVGGDASGAAALLNAQTNGSYYFLANLDVDNVAAEGAVVTLGASITDGVASSSDSNRRWPNDLAVRLAGANRTIGVINQGISGNRLLADGAGQSALNRFDRDVLAQPNVRWVIFSDDPINDLGAANPPTSDQLIAGLKELVSRAHAKGVKFLCSTLTPFQGSGGWSPGGETAREAIIAFIKSADSGCDRVVDQDEATHDPTKPTWYLPSYDAGDHLHPNEIGLQAIANAVDLAGLE
jgi:lysophospholipase L1-like esterase